MVCGTFNSAPADVRSGNSFLKGNQSFSSRSASQSSPLHFALLSLEQYAVEWLGHEVLCTAPVIFLEMCIFHDQWLDLTPMFQSVLCHSPSRKRNTIASLSLLSGLSPAPSILTFMSFQNFWTMAVKGFTMEHYMEIENCKKQWT